MNKDKIMIIGASILDILVSPADTKVFEAGSFAADTIKMSTGGDALNEATVLAALGKKVRLETIIGDDQAGEVIWSHIQKYGIETASSPIRANLDTGINVVLVQKNGERSFLTNPNASLRKLTIADITMPYPKDIRILCFASIFVFPELPAQKLKIIFSQAQKQGITVCADMTKCKNKETVADLAEALPYIDYLMPNKEEALLLTQTDKAEEAAEVLHRAGVKNIIIKCGPAGCYVKNQQLKTWIPAPRQVTCIDTTGAGDSFAAGFLYALSEGWSITKCATYANSCGAKAISTPGATTWLQSHSFTPQNLPPTFALHS